MTRSGAPPPDCPESRRRRTLTLATAVVATVAALAVAQPASAATPLLPDLGMARLTDLNATTTSAGRTLLRFSTTIVNVGGERFELVADRPDTGSSFTARQRVYRSDGSSSDLPVAAQMVFAGDGHSHWHVRNLESYVLERLDNGVKVGTDAKGGFCFLDTDPYRLALPGAPQTARYDGSGCGTQSALTLTMGLSVGWGDRYAWTLPDQYIDITGLTNGKYRLRATADAGGLFSETDEGNNQTWLDISLSQRRGGASVKVLGVGPVA